MGQGQWSSGMLNCTSWGQSGGCEGRQQLAWTHRCYDQVGHSTARSRCRWAVGWCVSIGLVHRMTACKLATDALWSWLLGQHGTLGSQHPRALWCCR